MPHYKARQQDQSVFVGTALIVFYNVRYVNLACPCFGELTSHVWLIIHGWFKNLDAKLRKKERDCLKAILNINQNSFVENPLAWRVF